MQANSEQKPEWLKWLGGGLVAAVSAWMALLAAVGLIIAGVASIFLGSEKEWAVIIFNLALAAGVLIPALPLGLLWPDLRIRRIFTAWSKAAGLAILLSLAGWLPQTAASGQALARGGLALAYSLLVWASLRRNTPAEEPEKRTPPTVRLLTATAAGLVMGYPWLAWGALGSGMDTLVQALSALVLGVAAVLTIEGGLDESHGQTFSGWRGAGRLGLDGFLAAGVLGILAAGSAFPYGILQFLLLGLPVLGWGIVALRRAGRPGKWQNMLPGIVLASLSLMGPLLFLDADELMPETALQSGDLMTWAALAAAVSLLIGLFTSLAATGAALARPWIARVRPQIRRGMATGALVAAVFTGAVIYLAAGQPGFYGEGLFVIMSTQADLSAAARIADPTARREAVYAALTAQANTSQAALRSDLERWGIAYTPYYLVNAIEVQGGPLVRLWLASRKDVDRVLDNPWLRPLPAIPESASGMETQPTEVPWNLQMIGADQVWETFGVRGAGIIIGQSDSGVDGSHPELAKQYRGAQDALPGQDYNWFDPWFDSQRPQDTGGHGTHTLGSILGQTVGVAPEASWIGCVNLGRNLGNPALYLDCMQFMLAPFPAGGDPLKDGRADLGANVLNNSWGCPTVEGCDPNTFLPAVEALRTAGVFVAASAGNDGPACSTLNTPLALYDTVFTVGAVNEAGSLASFSSIGPVTSDGSGRTKPDIVAPGEDVLSSFPNGTYETASGTSMAGPHVAGVVALMWSANPNLIGDIEQTEAILRETARPYEGALPACPGVDQVPSNAAGYGIVDAFAAVQAALKK